MEINPEDSVSNHGSDPLKEALQEIKNIEMDKNKDKEKTPIPQSIIFTIFGVILCFLSYIETSIIIALLFNFKNKNFEKSKMILEAIKYFALFLISLLLVRFKIKKPCIYHIILSGLFSFISYSSTYLYSRNVEAFISLSKLSSLIFVSLFFGIFNIIKVRKNHNFQFPNLVWIGLLLALSGILIEFISSYCATNENGEDNVRFIYHYNDYQNFFLCIANTMCYAAIIFIFDFYCKKLEIIFDTLLFVGLFSGIICFIISLCYSEINIIGSTFICLGQVQVNYYIVSVALFIFDIILQSILIKKCSIYSAGITISMQMSIRIIVDLIKYKSRYKANFFTLVSIVLCICGLFIICYYHILNNYNGEKKEINNESFASNEKKHFALINPVEQSELE